MAKKNPLNLNALQLKTLTLLQYLASQPGFGRPADDGAIEVTAVPHAHGNHFHLGNATVMTRDATGLANPAVWLALDRKGLIRSRFPDGATILRAGLDYETGLREEILHESDH